MTAHFDRLLSTIGAAADAASEWADSARQAPSVLIAPALVVAALLTVMLGLAFHIDGPHATDARSSESEPTWRYLLVCSACEYRQRRLDHPAETLEREGLHLKCPACGGFSADWYRWGSQNFPPGGWEITPNADSQNRLPEEESP